MTLTINTGALANLSVMETIALTAIVLAAVVAISTAIALGIDRVKQQMADRRQKKSNQIKATQWIL